MTANRRTGRRLWRSPVIVIIAAIMACVALDVCMAILALHTFLDWPPPQLKIIGRNCGHVYQGYIQGVSGSVYDPDQGELCLWHAYTTCQTSTLVVDFRGIDAGHTDAITVQLKAGHCAVTDTVRAYGEGVFGMMTSGSTDQCAGLKQLNGGLLLSDCGGMGDLSLSPRPPEQVGHVCGVILNANHAVSSEPPGAQDTVDEIEGCFWGAYIHCARPVTLIYEEANNLDYPLTEHTLVVQPLHGSCALTDVMSAPAQPKVTYTCASLTRGTDGSLEAQDCGAEIHIIIPF